MKNVKKNNEQTIRELPPLSSVTDSRIKCCAQVLKILHACEKFQSELSCFAAQYCLPGGIQTVDPFLRFVG